ncbi:hypothetical protein [Tsuneonella sp. HG222]
MGLHGATPCSGVGAVIEPSNLAMATELAVVAAFIDQSGFGGEPSALPR